MEIISPDRLQYLANQVSDMFREHTEISMLGNIALQVIIARREIEGIIEGKYSKKEKTHARLKLKQLKELEKNIIYLYTRNVSRPKEWLEKSFPFEYLSQNYR